MPYYKNEIKSRINRVMEKIEKNIYKIVDSLEVEVWVTDEPVTYQDRCSGSHRKISVGDTWGKLWDCAWFHFKGTVPIASSAKKVVLLIDISGEALVVDSNGEPLLGLTTVSSEFDTTYGRPGKRVLDVSVLNCTGGAIDLWADAGCNDLFGKYRDSGTLKEAYIAECNEQMRLLHYDFEVLNNLLQNLSENSARYNSILFTLNEAANVLGKYSEVEAMAARNILSKVLNKKSGDPSLTISAIGHAHIDLAWLWPVRETIRKGARTFSTALANMERYPDYVFGASQPQLYQWMKEYYPALFEKVKSRIAEGRWEVQGGMWVEPDTNISGGEALIRQVLYGKSFFRDEFGKDMKILWLPDVFGYNAALPQILKKSGIDYFMTIKLSWSRFNKHPHHTFWWQGLDGTRILAHMPPEGTYNSSALPRDVLTAEREYLDKGISENCLMLFGIGDGGGGPGEEHLERLQREKDLNGLVPVVQESALELFKKIEYSSSKYKTWAGELYLEFHQGTLTSQARNKRSNRKLEIALRELELVSSVAMVNGGMEYPAAELEKIWKEMLLYQFHDILPGSSITRVYDESLGRYKILMEQVQGLTFKTYDRLPGKGVEKGDYSIGVFNTLSWERAEWIHTDDGWAYISAKPMGYTAFNPASIQELPEYRNIDKNTIENDIYRIAFENDGSIRYIYDKENQKEVIAENSTANRLTVYEDAGNAWDFPIYYDEQPGERLELVAGEITIDGPRISRVNSYVYGVSRFTQEIVLMEGSRRIDFITIADWKESNRMLRTSFPVDVFATEASCEIQFGNVKRPVHRNTTWDLAKYEICAHKWLDLSQGDYGVALLNDCKYGHKVSENVIDLNLLRSTCEPDPIADRATHEFTYSLFPHKSDYVNGRVVRAGYELNMPLTIIPAMQANTAFCSMESFITVDSDNVIIESVKKCEYDNDLIVRMYECHGAGAKAKIGFGFKPKGIKLVNIMEEEIDQSCFNCEAGILTFRPFEIHTLKVAYISLNIQREPV